MPLHVYDARETTLLPLHLYTTLHFITSDILWTLLHICTNRACILNKLYHLCSDIYLLCNILLFNLFIFPQYIQHRVLNWALSPIKGSFGWQQEITTIDYNAYIQIQFTYVLLSIRGRIKVNISQPTVLQTFRYTLSNTYIRSGITGLGHQSHLSFH